MINRDCIKFVLFFMLHSYIVECFTKRSYNFIGSQLGMYIKSDNDLSPSHEDLNFFLLGFI